MAILTQVLIVIAAFVAAEALDTIAKELVRIRKHMEGDQ